MSKQYWNILLAILCLQFFFVGGGLLAQSNAEVNAGIQFSFSTPGARSLGMGGAFLGLADDATAAYANPAGVTALSRPEVSLEARHWRFTNVFTDKGRLSGTPTHSGDDTIAGLRDGHSDNNQDGLSFLSYVYPKPRWAIAVYRHELANLEADFNAQGAFYQDNNEDNRSKPTQNTLDLDIINFGVSAAFRIGDHFSLGGGISSCNFHLTSETDRFSSVNHKLVDTLSQHGSDRKSALNAGFLWAPNRAWRLGGVFRQGPSFKFLAHYNDSTGTKTLPAVFDTPDVFGLGVSFHPTNFKTLLLDVIHIRYSDLTRKFTNISPGSTGHCLDRPCRFAAPDATEIHLGFENIYSLPNWLIAARIGAWYDPGHRIHYAGDDPSFQILFRPGTDEIHYSAGLGYISGSGRYQVDAAIDLSERVKTASISAVIRF